MPPKDKPIQKTFPFFDDADGEINIKKISSEVLPIIKLAYDIDDIQLEKICIAILGLYDIAGVGFKTICGAYDENLLLSLWEENFSIGNHSFISKSKIEGLKDALANKDKVSLVLKSGKATYSHLLEEGVKFTTRGHKTYPQSFYKLSDAPRWLFVHGDIEVLQSQPIVGIVGTRESTPDGEALSREISISLTRQNISILSGLAQGIDEAAHLGCLEYYGLTIGVLGEGIQFTRVSQSISSLRSTIIERGGVIVSEYLPNDPPSQRSFLRRNAVIVGLSNAIIPVEFPKRKSGTGSTILHAKSSKTPVLGVLPEGELNHSLTQTRDNFLEERIPVFYYKNNLQLEIIDIFKSIFPNHKWEQGLEKQQRRFFNVYVRRLMQIDERLEFSSSSIDELIKMLKDEINKKKEK